jgi:hypothetical protein
VCSCIKIIIFLYKSSDSQEVEIGRITVQDQPRQKAWETSAQLMAGLGGECLSFQLWGKNK